MTDRTIAALATPRGMGGIAVIRVSGSCAIEICDSVFKGKSPLKDAESHTISYGHIINRDGELVDEVLVSVMRAPRTYTREDVVEISTHGGNSAYTLVMNELLFAGAYPAEPGEFTKRAFLNGRIDLSQAEGVIDIINAKTALSQKNALSQAEGRLSVKINEIRGALVHLAARMQVAIDYPDEDLEDITLAGISEEIKVCLDKTNGLLATADNGRVLRDGIKTAIVGKPNVGKSSLLNCLAGEERAIVTDIAGTTRDIIEEYVNLSGVPLCLLDTAGIRQTSDVVEKIGVDRSRRAVDEADLVILVVDAAAPIDDEDKELFELTSSKRRIIIANKTDKLTKCELQVPELQDNKSVILFSAKTGDGIDELAATVKELYNIGRIGQNDEVVVTNLRHISALNASKMALLRANDAVASGLPQDLAALDIYEAINCLGEITGDTVSEDIVSEIFHNFCVGK